MLLFQLDLMSRTIILICWGHIHKRLMLLLQTSGSYATQGGANPYRLYNMENF